MTLSVYSQPAQSDYWTRWSQPPPTIQGVTDIQEPMDSSKELGSVGSLNQFTSSVPMEQLMTVLSTMVMKINLNSIQALVSSMKINDDALLKIIDQQLQQQIEAVSKAMDPSQKPTVSDWIMVAANLLLCVAQVFLGVVTANPLLIVAAMVTVTSVVLDCTILIMRQMEIQPSEELKRAAEIFMWLTLAASVAVPIFSTIKSAFNIIKSVSAIKKFAMDIIRSVKDTIRSLMDKISMMFRNPTKFFKKPFPPKINRETICRTFFNITSVLEITVRSAAGIANGVAAYWSGMNKVALLTLENAIWEWQMGMEYCKQQAKRLQKAITDAYEQQNNGVDLAMKALKQIGGIQDRIASSLV